eukprot:CAMPEP_0113554416 /NCGR_PEP_ID=MMETSP0015_2-20120614/16137_1 /TAXON_ID=2838 /ORGANISM="Odontella" /LENGTH=349 /DNA_ID=CAMNT_0000455555 /DNA_START=171 /DNA_END=1220 /DNA_ORIENTATION=+ /assembly_acc=CAM_ASM_000160
MPLVTRRGEGLASSTRLGERPHQHQQHQHQQQHRRPRQAQQRRRRLSGRQAIILVSTLALQRSTAARASLRTQITSNSPTRRHGLFGAMAPKASADVAGAGGEASALRELKETVKNQAKEIDSLKRQLASAQKADGGATKKKASSAPSHGAHGGGGGDVEEEIHDYLDRPFLSLARHRVGWLSLFLASLSLTAVIMNGFEHTLSRQIELAYFVPLLAGHGGNTGGQTVGTVLAAMSSGVVGPSDAARVVGKEACSGLSVGVVLGLLVSTVSRFVMGVSPHVSTVVLFTIPLVSTIAATLASFLPFMCIALGLDPTVIAAPAMTSFVDVTGLLSYFLIAQAVFKMFGLEL